MVAQNNPHHADYARHGMWEPVQYKFKNLPVHTALLHTGKVLAFGGSGNDSKYLYNPHPAELWDYQDGTFDTVEQRLDGDTFCAGHTFLEDGRLLVAGGTYNYDSKIFNLFPLPPFSGMEQSYLFDPQTERWERTPDMTVGRWYPTLIQLADNSVLNIAGFTRFFPWVVLRSAEKFVLGQGWTHEPKADWWMPLYPRLHLLPDGKIFYAGSYNTHYTFPFTLSSFPTSILDLNAGGWKKIGLPKVAEREEGATVLLALTPPDYHARVLLTGGGKPTGVDPTAAAEIIDLSVPTPEWRAVEPMKNARYYAYATLLPNKQVLVLGGKKGERRHPKHDDHTMQAQHVTPPGEVHHDPLAILDCEIFDPATESWTTVAPMRVDRLYHSGALLLPDGRVFVSGSNPMREQNELRIEIYHPPYLFQGERPEIETNPSSVQYGEDFEISTPQAADIDEAAFIHPISTTHCFSTEQRYVGLEIIHRAASSLTLRVPTNKNLLPPGYYMLFILRAGVPSVAPFVHVG